MRPIKKTRPSPMKSDVAVLPTSDIRRFRIKVPPFSPEEPELWFALFEGQLETYGIKDDSAKFNQVLNNLDIVHAKAVKDLIVSPPARHKYVKIKAELVRRLSASHEKKVGQLLTHEELGDRKPSQFLRHLQDLAGPSVPADFVKTIWSQRLPSNIQTLVASQPTLSLEQLADLADHVHDIVTPCNVAAMSTSGNSNISSEIAALRKTVERLALKVDEQRAHSPHRASSRSRSRRQPHGSARHQSAYRTRSRSASEHKK
ncbi:uncharacterized protein LOC142985937 [Anticarsia gemmatalis]|uniref:uncharacterized protein LOC142985937 n=1 Tax=Anticarsia gemmatalis TaxID=129554 RepID=UPI003F77671D